MGSNLPSGLRDESQGAGFLEQSLAGRARATERRNRHFLDLSEELRTRPEQADARQLLECLSAVQRYVSTAIQQDERFLKQIDHPGADARRKRYREFSREISRLLEELGASPLALSFEAPRLLADWAREGIHGADREWIQFLRAG